MIRSQEKEIIEGDDDQIMTLAVDRFLDLARFLQNRG